MHIFVHCRQQIQWMSQQLSSEAVKCKQLEQKNLAMQHHLEDLLGHNYVLVEKQTMDAIQQAFSDFEKFIQKLRNLGYYLYLSCCCSPSLLLSHFVLCIKCLKRHCVVSVGRPVVKSRNTCNLKNVVPKCGDYWMQSNRIFLNCISHIIRILLKLDVKLFCSRSDNNTFCTYLCSVYILQYCKFHCG